MMRAYFILIFAFALTALHAQDRNTNSRKLLAQGESAYNTGDYTLALGYFSRCIAESPGMSDAYLMRGSTRERLKDLSGANTDYTIYLELEPDQTEALFSRARVRYQLGLYAQSKDDFLKVLTSPPGETNTIFFNLSASSSGSNQIMTAQSAIKPQLFNYLGLVEAKLNNYKAAISWLDSAIQLEPKNADYYVNRGIVKESMNDSSAMTDYQKAVSLKPDHAMARHNMSVLRRKGGESIDGNDDLEKAIESDSSMLYPYLERGYQRMEGGYYKGALEDYDHALKINGKDPEIWLNRGHVKEKLNDLKGAYSDYTKAVELDEKFVKAWVNRGNVLSRQGRIQEAIEDYTVAITYNPEYAAAYHNRAIARQKLKQSADACADLNKAEALGLAVGEKMKAEICK